MIEQFKEYPETYAKLVEYSAGEPITISTIQRFLYKEGFEFSFDREVFNNVQQQNVIMNSATFQMRFKSNGNKPETLKVMNSRDEFFLHKESLFINCFQILEY